MHLGRSPEEDQPQGSLPLMLIEELVEGSQDRASGGAIGLIPHASGTINRSASLLKKRGWPSTASCLSSRSRQLQGSCLVDHRAMPPLTTIPSSDCERRGNGT